MQTGFIFLYNWNFFDYNKIWDDNHHMEIIQNNGLLPVFGSLLHGSSRTSEQIAILR